MTPEQEEQVRRALRAAAQADDPGRMPPEVANRLDEVLADLAGPKGQPKEHVGAAADELAARRKRRWPNVVVAAAAVAVIVAVGGAVATGGFGTLGGGGDSTSAEKAASSDAGGAAPSTTPSAGGQRGLAGEVRRPGRPAAAALLDPVHRRGSACCEPSASVA